MNNHSDDRDIQAGPSEFTEYIDSDLRYWLSLPARSLSTTLRSTELIGVESILEPSRIDLMFSIPRLSKHNALPAKTSFSIQLQGVASALAYRIVPPGGHIREESMGWTDLAGLITRIHMDVEEAKYACDKEEVSGILLGLDGVIGNEEVYIRIQAADVLVMRSDGVAYSLSEFEQMGDSEWKNRNL